MTPRARDEFIRTRTGALVTTLLQGSSNIPLQAIRECSQELVDTAYLMARQMADLVALANEDDVVKTLENHNTA